MSTVQKDKDYLWTYDIQYDCSIKTVELGSYRPDSHGWELRGNYPVFDVVMGIYH